MSVLHFSYKMCTIRKALRTRTTVVCTHSLRYHSHARTLPMGSCRHIIGPLFDLPHLLPRWQLLLRLLPSLSA
jgi:hypothetical protein